MQRPIVHHIIATSPRQTRERSWTTLLVAGLHVGLIYALITGLTVSVVRIMTPDFVVHVFQPTQPRIDLPRPPPMPVTMPKFPIFQKPVVEIEQQKTDTITTTNDGTIKLTSIPADPVVKSKPAYAVPGTHTIPDYPMLSRRLGEEGMVLLRIGIADTGQIENVTIVHSSGYLRLDEAAREWVMRYWRYKPATTGEKPVRSVADASVVFNLKNATPVR